MIRSSTIEYSREPAEAGGKRSLENACVPLDRSPAALALALILFVTVMIAALASAVAAEGITPGAGECTLLTLGDTATVSTGAPVAVAEITICYRPLPGDQAPAPHAFGAPAHLPVLATRAAR